MRFHLSWKHAGITTLFLLLLACGGGSNSTTSSGGEQSPHWTPGSEFNKEYQFYYGDYPPDYFGQLSYAGVDAKENAMALLEMSENGKGHIFAQYYDAHAKAWQPAQDIETPNAVGDMPSLVMFPDGDAIATWRENAATTSDLEIATYTPKSGWSAPHTLVSGIYEFTLVGGGEDQAIVVWQSLQSQGGTSTMKFGTSILSPATGWSSPMDLGVGSTDGEGLSVAMSPQGEALVAWSSPNSHTESSQILERHFIPGTGWTSSVQLNVAPTPGTAGANPLAAFNSKGQAVVVWAQLQTIYDEDPSQFYGTWFSYLNSSTGWTSPKQGPASFTDKMVLADDGSIVAVGRTPNPMYGNTLFTLDSNIFGPSGVKPLKIDLNGSDPGTPMLTKGTNGNVFLSFLEIPSELPSGGVESAFVCHIRLDSGATAWSKPQMLSNPVFSDVTALQVVPYQDGTSGARAFWVGNGYSLGAVSATYQ